MSITAKRRRWKTAAKFVIGIGLLLGLVAMVDLDSLVATVISADPLLLILSFGLFVVHGIFEAGRLSIVFSQYGMGVADGFRLFLVGMFFNNFTPGMIGADIYQVQQMHSVRPGLLRPLSLSLFLRFSGLLVNLGLLLLALLLMTKSWSASLDFRIFDSDLVRWVVAGMLGLTLTAVLALAVPSIRQQARQALAKSSRLVAEARSVARSFSLAKHLLIVLLGTLVVLVKVASLLVLVSALGGSMPFVVLLLTATVTRMALVLPISFAGLGVSEISVAAIFVAFGLPTSIAVAVPLLARCFTWILSLAGGFWFLLASTPQKQGS